MLEPPTLSSHHLLRASFFCFRYLLKHGSLNLHRHFTSNAASSLLRMYSAAFGSNESELTYEKRLDGRKSSYMPISKSFWCATSLVPAHKHPRNVSTYLGRYLLCATKLCQVIPKENCTLLLKCNLSLGE